MPDFDADALLAMLRDPNCETQQIADRAGVSREEAGRACRVVMGIARAKPEEAVNLPAPLAMAVLRAAVAAQRTDVLAAAAAHPSKEVAKEGKRALYLLRTRGVAVPETPRAVPAPAPAPPEPPVPCYASALDGRGERAVWIGRAVPGKGVEVAQVVLSDQQGVIELHVGMVGRKEYRGLARDLLERGRSMGVAEIDREVAKGMVAAARALNGESHPPPEGTDAWLARQGPATPPPDPEARFSPLPPAEEQAAVDASAALHDLPLVRGWLAEEGDLRALARKLDEIAVSSLYLDERQREQAAARAVADAVSAAFEGPRRALWAGRLFTLAEHLERGGDAGGARLAAAAARALRAGTDASRIPFARLLVEKAFPAVASRPSAAPPAEDSLLVQPPR